MRRRARLPRSLRARLVAGLLVVAALGLVVFGAVTYAEQRSFLRERVEQQARAGAPAIELTVRRRAGADGYDDPAGRGGGPPPFASLPAGSYGELRTPAGRLVPGSRVQFAPDDTTTLPVPELPATLRAGELRSVGATGGGSGFLVSVQPDRERTLLVVTAVPLTEVDDALRQLLLIEGVVAAVVLLALAALTWLLVRVGLRPLERIARTADEIAGGRMQRRVAPAGPETEVGRLGLALNGMLDRLEVAFAEREASEERLRAFLADASHELRTPLASIRAYAELFRMGAATTPQDIAKAMDRIESESARMGVLVEDLLMLARLDEVRQATPEPIDVAALAADAVDDTRAAAPDRAVHLHVGEPAVAVADPDGVRQVLANLLRNATIHTPAGTPIEVRVDPLGDRLRLEVRDHGPGLPPDDPEAVFGRFWRAEGGRRQGPAGAGLGLSIVAGLVAAQGGTASAHNAPDGGAVFRVELPAAEDPDAVGDTVGAGTPGRRLP